MSALIIPSLSRTECRARTSRRLLLACGTTLVLLLMVASLWQETSSLRALGDLREQGERLQHLDGMLIQLMDAESAARGYLLSGNRAQLEPFAEHRASVENTLQAIRRDLAPSSGNDAVLADLSWLIAHKLSNLDHVVGRGKPGNRHRDKGVRQVDGIRDRLSGLKASMQAEAQVSVARSTYHLERARWVATGLAVAALLLMLALYVAMERQLQLREQLAGVLRTENRHLDSLVRERTTELNDLASHLTNASEAEKARLARELHDELGALLTAAKMETNWVNERLDETAVTGAGPHLARLRTHLDRGLALKRRIIDGLRPPFLEELGLINALRTLGEEFELGGNEALCLDLPADEVHLTPASALALYRIAQEALTNIRRHACAKSVELGLRVTGTRTLLEVADDGIGFDAESRRTARHGLAGMRHRVQMCAGEFNIRSAPGVGTRIIVSLPEVTPRLAFERRTRRAELPRLGDRRRGRLAAGSCLSADIGGMGLAAW